MFGIGTKVMGGVALAGMVAAGIFYMQWQDTRDDVATLRENNATLKESLASTNARMEQALETIENQRQRREKLHAEISKLQEARSSALRRIDTLRAAEHSRALEDPFVRGSAAAERLSRIMQSIQRAGDGGDAGSEGESTTVSPPSSDAPGPGGDSAPSPNP